MTSKKSRFEVKRMGAARSDWRADKVLQRLMGAHTYTLHLRHWAESAAASLAPRTQNSPTPHAWTQTHSLFYSPSSQGSFICSPKLLQIIQDVHFLLDCQPKAIFDVRSGGILGAPILFSKTAVYCPSLPGSCLLGPFNTFPLVSYTFWYLRIPIQSLAKGYKHILCESWCNPANRRHFARCEPNSSGWQRSPNIPEQSFTVSSGGMRAYLNGMRRGLGSGQKGAEWCRPGRNQSVSGQRECKIHLRKNQIGQVDCSKL